MIEVDKLLRPNQSVVEATADHARAISEIYRLVQIEPQVLLDLASSRAQRIATARQYISTHGGFLCPPDDADMHRTMNHGLVKVFLQDGEVVGYNRYVTDPVMVRQVMFAEFQLDPTKDYPEHDQLQNWSGRKKLKHNKTLRRIEWLDKKQALIALNAAQAGLRKLSTGKLAWAVDAAVHPDNQHAGIAKILSNSMRRNLTPGVAYLACRMFKITSINNVDVDVHNDPSKRVFMESTSTPFAYTEEEIHLENGIHITVRWNHWLRYYVS